MFGTNTRMDIYHSYDHFAGQPREGVVKKERDRSVLRHAEVPLMVRDSLALVHFLLLRLPARFEPHDAVDVSALQRPVPLHDASCLHLDGHREELRDGDLHRTPRPLLP